MPRTAPRCSAPLLLALALTACGGGDAPPDPTALVADLSSTDQKTSGDARLALITLGDTATPALVELLENGAPRERLLAATTFWGMGARAPSAVPALAAGLADADAEVRVTCAMALENMGPAARDAVPALVKALRDRHRPVRQAAVKALGAIGPQASPALPALDRAVERETWPEAEEAILRIRGASGAADTLPSGDGR